MAQMTLRFAATLILGFAVSSYGQSSSNLSVQQVLANPNIWGKDLPTALADASAMHKTGETQVAVFLDKVQSTTSAPIEQAEVHLAAVRHALSSISQVEKAEYHKVLNCRKGTTKAM